jgi:hypothetical protein
MDDGSLFGQLRNLLKQGVDPDVIRTLGPGGAQAFSGAKARTAEAGQQALTGARQLGQSVMKRPGLAAGVGATALGVAPGAMQAFQQQGLLGGALSTAAGLGTAAVVSPIAGALMKGPGLAKVAGFGLQALAPALAQAGVSSLSAKAEEAGQRPGGGTDVEIAGVPLTETAVTRRQREFDRAQTLQDIQQIGGAELALNKELLGFMMTQEVQQAKAMAPVIERAQRAQLTNAQAMLNSQTAAYQQLGRSAMMGRLATVGQQERGATMRQALATNPYIGATLQAPQISFG